MINVIVKHGEFCSKALNLSLRGPTKRFMNEAEISVTIIIELCPSLSADIFRIQIYSRHLS